MSAELSEKHLIHQNLCTADDQIPQWYNSLTNERDRGNNYQDKRAQHGRFHPKSSTSMLVFTYTLYLGHTSICISNLYDFFYGSLY